MSEPINPVPQRPIEPVQYQSVVAAPLDKMALTSMILGIIAIPTGCIGIGVLIGIIALILGIISLSRISKNPAARSGKGYAITGIVTGALGGVFMAPLLIAILLPSLGRARELANRTACAANLTGITKAMLVYANENSDNLPATNAGSAPVIDWGVTGGSTQLKAQENILTAGAGNPASCMWILVLNNSVSPKSFVCKSDPQGDSVPSPVQIGSDYLMNPSKKTQLSYSMDFPWVEANGHGGATGGWWKNTVDSSLPLMADMVLGGGMMAGPGGTPKAMNSTNHNGDGQNIAFGDCHAEWTRTPQLSNGDDIRFYTSGSPGDSSPSVSWPIGDKNEPPYNIIMTPHKTTAGVVDP